MNDCDVCVETTPIPAAPPCPPAAPCPPRICDPQEWICGGWLYKEANGCTTRTRLAGVLPDGVYTNPVITLENGCISKIENGDRVLQMRPNPCTTPSSGGGGTAPAAVTLNPSNCNLTSSGALGLMTTAVFDNVNSNVQVTGCGTSTNPWVLTAPTSGGGTPTAVTFKCGVSVQNPLVKPVVKVETNADIASLATFTYDAASCTSTLNFSGVDYNKCGTEIVKGVVKTFGGFVKAVSVNSNISTVASITTDAATCSATINLNGADYNQDGIEIVKGVVKSFTLPSQPIVPAARCVSATGDGIIYGSPNKSYTITNITTSASSTIAIPASGAFAFNQTTIPAGLHSASVNGVLVGYFEILNCVVTTSGGGGNDSSGGTN